LGVTFGVLNLWCNFVFFKLLYIYMIEWLSPFIIEGGKDYLLMRWNMMVLTFIYEIIHFIKKIKKNKKSSQSIKL
jgi:hypothetical protein